MVSVEKDEAVAKHQTHKKMDGIHKHLYDENICIMVIRMMMVKLIQATLKTGCLSREFSKWEIVRCVWITLSPKFKKKPRRNMHRMQKTGEFRVYWISRLAGGLVD